MLNKQTFYNEFYKTYGPKIHDDPVRFAKIASLCYGSVLDLGCGSGTLADFYSGFYQGLDVSDVAIEQARAVRRPGSHFAVRDICDPNLNTFGPFDVVVLSEVLEHLENDETLFVNVKKYLKHNGRLIISVPNSDRVPDEDHKRRFTVPELRKRFSEFGRVKFYNYPGFTERILMSVDFNKIPDYFLSLVMIVKNEELGLENAILSCIEMVDKIVIAVDTTSTDKTLEIAKRYADEVRFLEWQGDFSKARNFVQEDIKTKWVLILDGHEYVEKVVDLTKYLVKDYQGIKTRVKLENGFTYWFPRILRSQIKWSRPVHNYPETYRNGLCEELVVVHDREHSQSKLSKEARNKQRNEMIISIMHDEIKKNPKEFRPYYYLAQHYFLERQFKKSIQYYHKYLRRSNWKGERWLVYYDIARAHACLNHTLRALFALRDAEKEIPGRWEIPFSRGLVWLMAQNWPAAIQNLVSAFDENLGKFTYYPIKRDNAFIWQAIGYCCEKLKNYHEGELAYRRALQLEKEKPEKEQDQTRVKILEFLLNKN